MHTLNDLGVLLSEPYTQAYFLEILREDQSIFIDATLEKQMKLTTQEAKDQVPEEGDKPQLQEDKGQSSIRPFLKSLVQILLQSGSASPLAGE